VGKVSAYGLAIRTCSSQIHALAIHPRGLWGRHRLQSTTKVVARDLGVVLERRLRFGVSGQLVDLRDRCARPYQGRDVVRTQAVKIRHTIVGRVWHTAVFKVGTDRLGRVVVQWEDGLATRLVIIVDGRFVEVEAGTGLA
jgi:hypothetical protein